MRELRPGDVRTRVKGIPALTRRLYGLHLAVERFGRHRAQTRDEQAWAGRVAALLAQVITEARRPAGPPRAVGRVAMTPPAQQ